MDSLRIISAWLMLALLALVPLSAGPAEIARPAPAVPGTFADYAGLYVVDLSTGEPVMEINADKLFIPASVTKAVTTASVMCIKDSAERFVTPAVAFGRIDNGTLHGNILISCSGDPTIESAHMPAARGIADSIAASVRELGIRHITGKIIVDEAALPRSGIPNGWLDEDLLTTYGAELFAANYADNLTTLTLPSERTSPSTPGLKIEYAGGKGKAHLSRDRARRSVTVKGAVPRKGLSQRIANPLPSSTLAEAVRSRLAAAGIAVEGADIKPEKDATVVYTHVSPRFVDIMRSLMVRSDNLFAEGMLRTLAPGEERSEALAEELQVWSDNEIDTSRIFIEDGSGLSRSNRISPRFLGNVLDWMSQSLVAQSYARLFPRVGREGTVRGFLKGTPLEGRMALKTGSMRGVQCYAGYMFDDNGVPSHAIVVMANNFKCSRPALKSTVADILLQIFAPDAEVPDSADTVSESLSDNIC